MWKAIVIDTLDTAVKIHINSCGTEEVDEERAERVWAHSRNR